MSHRRQRMVLWGFCALCSLMFLGLMAPAAARSSNCGGNSAALVQCQHIAIRVLLEAAEHRFDAFNWSKDARDEISSLRLQHWTKSANYLVRTKIAPDASELTIVAVRNPAFGNVPRPTVWNFYRHNQAHAAGYLDGTTGLISPEEFRHLDLGSFTNAASLAVPQP